MMTASDTIELQGAWSRSVATTAVDVVLDIDSEKRLIGIEILGVRDQLRSVPSSTSGQGILNGSVSCEWAFDPQADAIYVRLGVGRSRDQLNAVVTVSAAADSMTMVVPESWRDP